MVERKRKLRMSLWPFWHVIPGVISKIFIPMCGREPIEMYTVHFSCDVPFSGFPFYKCFQFRMSTGDVFSSKETPRCAKHNSETQLRRSRQIYTFSSSSLRDRLEGNNDRNKDKQLSLWAHFWRCFTILQFLLAKRLSTTALDSPRNIKNV